MTKAPILAVCVLVALIATALPVVAQFETRSSTNIATAPFAMAVGDFNGDGKLDMAVSSYIPNNGVTILLGNGDGTFQVGASYAVGSDLDYLVSAKLRNSGIADLILQDRGSNNVYVMLGNGDGTFQTAVPYPTVGVGRQRQFRRFYRRRQGGYCSHYQF